MSWRMGKQMWIIVDTKAKENKRIANSGNYNNVVKNGIVLGCGVELCIDACRMRQAYSMWVVANHIRTVDKVAKVLGNFKEVHC